MTLKMKHFDEFDAAETILLSAEEPDSLNKLLETVDRIISKENGATILSHVTFLQLLGNVDLVFQHCHSNKGLYKEEGTWVLKFNTEEWHRFKDLVTALIHGGHGHQYIDSESDNISLIVSLNEYPSDWVGWLD